MFNSFYLFYEITEPLPLKLPCRAWTSEVNEKTLCPLDWERVKVTTSKGTQSASFLTKNSHQPAAIDEQSEQKRDFEITSSLEHKQYGTELTVYFWELTRRNKKKRAMRASHLRSTQRNTWIWCVLTDVLFWAPRKQAKQVPSRNKATSYRAKQAKWWETVFLVKTVGGS